MNNTSQVLILIKEELEKKKPLKRKINNYFYEVYTKKEDQHPSESDFLELAKETYKLNPRFSMNFIYPEISAPRFPSPPSVKEKITNHIIESVSLDSAHILNSIKEELEKINPSRKIILSYLFDEQLFSYSEFYEIVGETYKLNPKFFLKSLYKDVKKRTSKLHGDEKLKVMETFIIENYALKSGKQILDSIKKELTKARPSKSIILSYIFDFQLVFYSALFDVVGETFKLNPEFYMNNLYGDIETRTYERYGEGKVGEMQKYIVERFCLNDGEQIHYECPSVFINYWENPTLKSRGFRVIGATLFVTNYRIIAQGLTWKQGGEASSGKRALKTIMDLSIQQECYGYVFPIKNLISLKKTSKGVSYDINLKVKNTNRLRNISIELVKSPKREEQKHELFEILIKELDEKFDKLEHRY